MLDSSSRLTLSNSPLSRDEVEGRCDVSSGDFGCFVSSSSYFSLPFISFDGRLGTSSVSCGLVGKLCLVNDLVLWIPSIVGVGVSASAVSLASSNVSYRRAIR